MSGLAAAGPRPSTVEALDGFGWGLIGASTIAREYMADAIRRTGGRLLSVMSHDGARAATFARDLDIPGSCSDLDVLLTDPQIAAVYVSSTNTQHRHQVLAAAAAGKHVLCDKPLATRFADALRMVRACDKAGVVLAVNHHLRSSPVHQTMQRMIAAGEIGVVRSLMIVHAGYLRPVLQSWRIKDAAEGGIYLDLSVHDVDLASFLLEQTPVTAVALGAGVALGSNTVHDHAMYALKMSGGAFVQVHESFVTPDVESQVVALGSEGALIAAGTLAQRSTGTLTRRVNGHNESIPLRANDLYADTINQFLGAIAGTGSPRATGRDGLAALAGAEAVAKAATTGKAVAVRHYE
ncbi:Gfo/Idh/MocA family oxidoreductase [Mesorhizobium sp. M0938]|uniref:Gfo/Idh/MocA family protein n=1 Tax=unclassified Mesorhizobium TaxID=325217 RepID=UPI003334BBBA